MSAPPSPTLSVAATVAPPDMENIHELMSIMKHTMETLGGTFETMNQTSIRVQEIQNEPALNAVQQITDLRKQLVKKDRRQEEKVKDIEHLLREVLQHEIVEHLKGQIQQQIEDIIEEEVERQVQVQLGYHIPPQLQESVAAHKRQLDEVQYSMRNSEARRANGQLRANNLHGPMQPLLMNTGDVSEHFPKDMSDLFKMDTDSITALLSNYDIPAGKSREENLNNFMRFCNIGYQMVPMEPPMALTL
ncbi:hypothetical protein DL93DRAFT_2165506 [Clavulina sp. PMI_390]|nr:hypothetical protein DL93DRAFT_2165506 [Clavulina sp. PMI_390]